MKIQNGEYDWLKSDDKSLISLKKTNYLFELSIFDTFSSNCGFLTGKQHQKCLNSSTTAI